MSRESTREGAVSRETRPTRELSGRGGRQRHAETTAGGDMREHEATLPRAPALAEEETPETDSCIGKGGERSSVAVRASSRGGPLELGYTRAEMARSARGDSPASPLPWKLQSYRHILMSVLAPAVGAVLAAILESSVLTHLQVGSVKPDLVFAVGIAIAMVLGFESGMTWAFVGGITLDLLLPGRALGSSALTLVLVTAGALVVARAMWPPRLAVISATSFGLTFVYQLLLLGLLAITAGVAFSGLALTDLILIGVLNTVITAVAVVVVRALDQRFGEPERMAW